MQEKRQEVKPPLQPRAELPKEVIEIQIARNGRLVSELIASEVWREILSPLIDETIASVSGRKTNGRWYHGELTKSKEPLEFLKGYQKCGMDIHNHIMDFISAKTRMEQRKQQELENNKAQVINPFMEGFDNNDEWGD